MKTAMQELIDYFNERPEYDKTSEGYEIIEKAKQLLEKEKEQIIDAFDYGYHCASNGTSAEITLDGKMHYNQTYNQKK